jgi:hypothetical protein
MKAISLSRLIIAAPLLLTPLAVVAQVGVSENPPSLNLTPPPDPLLNRLSLSYRMGFNISTKFSGLGGYQSPNNPGPATGGDLDRTYDDGFDRRDISDADGLTWNWGYKDYPRQISGDSLLLSISSSEANGVSGGHNEDPLHGFEVSYQRRFSKGEKWYWGLELAFNYTGLEINDTRTLYGAVTTITDAYALGGIIPPHAPVPAMAYEGTYAGPGALISDTPTRLAPVTIPDGAITTGRRDLDASIYGFRVGPYLQIQVDGPVWLSFSSGLAVALVDSDFSFSEMTTIGGVGTPSSRSGHDDRCDALFGWYVAGQCTWALDERWSVFGGVQYQDVGHFSQTAGGAKAELDLSQSVFVTLGVGYSF